MKFIKYHISQFVIGFKEGFKEGYHNGVADKSQSLVKPLMTLIPMFKKQTEDMKSLMEKWSPKKD